MSTCQRVPEDGYSVVIRHPKSLRTRCGESWNFVGRQCGCVCVTFMVLSMLFLVWGLMWVMIFCQDQPGMSLQGMSIKGMRAYENTTVAPPQSPWQVDSGFSVTLLTWNPNTVAKCFSTFRRVVVRVEYRGQVIVQQEVPLGFGLKPQRSRSVSVDVEGSGFRLKNPDLGPFMQNELRSDNLSLDFYFDARYMRNDRKAGWLNLGCRVVAKPPPSNTSSQAPAANSLLTKDCLGL